MKLATANPLVVALAVALLTSILLPAVLAAGTAASHAFIASFEIQDADGIHSHIIAARLIWPALGLLNFLLLGIVVIFIALVLRKSPRVRVNRTIVVSAIVWCIIVGAVIAFQTRQLARG